MNPYAIDWDKVRPYTRVDSPKSSVDDCLFYYKSNLYYCDDNKLLKYENRWIYIYIYNDGNWSRYLPGHSTVDDPTLPSCILDICKIWVDGMRCMDLPTLLYKTIGD